MRCKSTSKRSPEDDVPTDHAPTVSLLASESPPGTGTEDDVPTDHAPSVSVLATSKTFDGKRIYDKKQYCHFCETLVLKYARHLERRHSKEVDVAKALSFPKNSKERKRQLEILRNKGNFQYNAWGCLIEQFCGNTI